MAVDGKTVVSNFIERNANLLWIYLKVVVIFAVLYGIYHFYLQSTGLYVGFVGHMTNCVSTVLDWLGLEHTVKYNEFLKSGVLRTPEWAEIAVDKRVDGIFETSLLIAFIAAWPGSLRLKIPYLAVTVLLMYGLTIGRSVAALWVDQYAPLYFDAFALWVLPFVLIFFVMLFFSIWILLAREV